MSSVNRQGTLGIAVVGAGRIGTLRARLAARHPCVGFLAISDSERGQGSRARRTDRRGSHSTNNFEIIERPEVNAVFVSTPEGEHAAPVIRALELGKPVLVEKPIALDRDDADRIIETLRRTNGKLRIGYSRRFKECFLRAKEQMIQGRLGTVVGGLARVYNSRAQAFSILKRDPHATPSWTSSPTTSISCAGFSTATVPWKWSRGASTASSATRDTARMT